MSQEYTPKVLAEKEFTDAECRIIANSVRPLLVNYQLTAGVVVAMACKVVSQALSTLESECSPTASTRAPRFAEIEAQVCLNRSQIIEAFTIGHDDVADDWKTQIQLTQLELMREIACQIADLRETK